MSKKGDAGKKLRLATGIANGQLAVCARLVMLQRVRLEAKPPEGDGLGQWLADYEAVFAEYGPAMWMDAGNETTFADLFPVETCKTVAEGPLEDLRRRAAAMGATVNATDKVRVAAAGWQQYVAQGGR